jgi:hypothetical protein
MCEGGILSFGSGKVIVLGVALRPGENPDDREDSRSSVSRREIVKAAEDPMALNRFFATDYWSMNEAWLARPLDRRFHGARTYGNTALSDDALRELLIRADGSLTISTAKRALN